MKVIFTPFAIDQLDSLHRYISERSYESRADAYIKRIETYCQSLSTFPMRGTARDHIYAGLRTIGFERRATIAFIVADDAVYIEGVFYGGQNWQAHFNSET